MLSTRSQGATLTTGALMTSFARYRRNSSGITVSSTAPNSVSACPHRTAPNSVSACPHRTTQAHTCIGRAPHNTAHAPGILRMMVTFWKALALIMSPVNLRTQHQHQHMHQQRWIGSGEAHGLCGQHGHHQRHPVLQLPRQLQHQYSGEQGRAAYCRGDVSKSTTATQVTGLTAGEHGSGAHQREQAGRHLRCREHMRHHLRVRSVRVRVRAGTTGRHT